MKITFLIIVLVHALIHLLGFVKGFKIKEIKELTTPVSQTMAVAWLIAALLLLTFAIMYASHADYAWLVGAIALSISQLLIILFWKDAKFGTIPNILIAVASIAAWGDYHFAQTVRKETQILISANNTFNQGIVTETDIAQLPEPVKNWLRHCGAVGKPFIHLGKVLQHADMKMKPEQENWMPATAVQFTAIDHPAFIWTVKANMNSLLRFKGIDRFENGKGRMLIQLNALVNVVNEQGPKLDEGVLQRYLGEMVWFPSLALSKYISWEQLNDTTAKATMQYKGTSGSGIFYFNKEGRVEKFTAMRFKDNKAQAKRQEWIMQITAYKTFEGISVPAKMTATWIMENTSWTWLKLSIESISYNENVLK